MSPALRRRHTGVGEVSAGRRKLRGEGATMEDVTTAEAAGGPARPAAPAAGGPAPGAGSGARGVCVRLLGQFTVTSGRRPAGRWQRPTARRLCELVLIAPGRRVSRALAWEELFPGMDPRSAARALSKALSMARASLAELGEPGASLLSADLTHIWASPLAQVDAVDQLAGMTGALAMGPGRARDQALVAALADEGDLLADEPYAEWAARPREHLAALRQEARLALARDLAGGHGHDQPSRPSRPDAAMGAWLAVFEHDPACEEAAGALMRGYLAQGRRELAARIYERCAAALAELALRASPSLDELHVAVTQPPLPGAPVVPGPAVPFVAPASPEAQGPAPREELRPVTMLFAEVGAHTGPGGRLDPEAIRDVVGSSLAAVIAEVEALGGPVTSVPRRGGPAMWGAPPAPGDA